MTAFLFPGSCHWAQAFYFIDIGKTTGKLIYAIAVYICIIFVRFALGIPPSGGGKPRLAGCIGVNGNWFAGVFSTTYRFKCGEESRRIQ